MIITLFTLTFMNAGFFTYSFIYIFPNDIPSLSMKIRRWLVYPCWLIHYKMYSSAKHPLIRQKFSCASKYD